MIAAPNRKLGARAVGGFTLVEVMVTTLTLMLIFGVLGQALVQGLETVARTRAAARAASEASMGIQTAFRDLSDAAVLTDVQSYMCRYRRPLVGDDGKYIIVPQGESPGPFTHVAPGDEIEIYYNADARTLTITELDSPTADSRVIVENVEYAHFYYEGRDPDSEILSPWDMDSVTLELVTEGESNGRWKTSALTKTAKLRNHL